MAEIKVTHEVAKPEAAPVMNWGEFFKPMIPFGRMWGMNPFALMREFTEEMDRSFTGWVPKLETKVFAPAVDIKLAGGNYVVTADLPGLKKEEVKVEVTEDAIVLEGERKTEAKEEKAGYRKLERHYGKFYREIPLPAGAKINEAKAELNEGVLTITMPVPVPEVKGKQIPIQEVKAPKAA